MKLLMRILISFTPKFDVSEDAIVKHDIQGFIYNLIKYKEAKISLDHDKHHFKFFCFSDVFPQGDFKKGEIKNLISGETSSFGPNNIKNGILIWPLKNEIVKEGFYEIAVPSFNSIPKYVSVLKVVNEKPLAWSEPKKFSPNGDGINDTAKIRFELSEECEVAVKIYNQIGKLVHYYGKQYFSAGYNEVLWEGINNAGRRINNGVYIYHIKEKSSSELKMLNFSN